MLVFAAASLNSALEEVAAASARAGGGRVALAFAASSTLARQIEQGAPADLFVSASVKWMDYLAERRLIVPASRVDLLRNRLVLVAPAAGSARVAIEPGFPLARLLGGGRLAMGDPVHVPAGQYGRAALESLGVWRSVERRIAAADHVRAALALVSRGEAPYGVVYATDAAADPGVRVVAEFPPASHPPIVYPVARLARSAHPAAAGLLEFLRGAPAQAIFARHGFAPAR